MPFLDKPTLKALETLRCPITHALFDLQGLKHIGGESVDDCQSGILMVDSNGHNLSENECLGLRFPLTRSQKHLDNLVGRHTVDSWVFINLF